MALAPGEGRSEHLRKWLLGVDAARVDVNQCPLAWKARLLAGKAAFIAQQVEQVSSIGSVKDTEVRRQPKRGGVNADQLVSCRMKGSANHIRRDVRSEERARAGEHLPGSAPREGQDENSVGRNALLHQPADATAKCCRFASPGSG
jgi:hypothetical protein